MRKIKFKCCATCINYVAKERLCGKDGRNWPTHPKNEFDCWVPNDKVKERMLKLGVNR